MGRATPLSRSTCCDDHKAVAYLRLAFDGSDDGQLSLGAKALCAGAAQALAPASCLAGIRYMLAKRRHNDSNAGGEARLEAVEAQVVLAELDLQDRMLVLRMWSVNAYDILTAYVLVLADLSPCCLKTTRTLVGSGSGAQQWCLGTCYNADIGGIGGACSGPMYSDKCYLILGCWCVGAKKWAHDRIYRDGGGFTIGL